MDNTSMEHYEKQLYTVFKTFDVDNDEALDESAVMDLCNALQLDDKGASLVKSLFERPEERVTFTQFRNGLLSVLGGGEPTTAGVPHSDDDSSGREVAPKFVYGSKKYGRRSKPQNAASSTGRQENDINNISANNNSMNLSKDEASQPKSPAKHKQNILSTEKLDTISLPSEQQATNSIQFEHDRYIDFEEALLLCHDLGMDNIEKHLIVQVFKEAASPDDKITVGEFFQQLNNCLSLSVASCDKSAISHNDSGIVEKGLWNGIVDSKQLLEIWEQSGIVHGLELLHELGFSTPTVNVLNLSNALDEEIRVLANEHDSTHSDAHNLLLQASLAIHRLQFIEINNVMEQVFIENNKLKNDLTDANRRAQVLALEVDDSHARLETSLKNKMKLMEIKHNENMKLAKCDWALEKERFLTTIGHLEKNLSRLTVDETRLNSEKTKLLNENDEMKKKITSSEERINELETTRNQLTKELKMLTSAKMQVSEDNDNQNRLKELTQHLKDLEIENKLLRDKNDELCAEMYTRTGSTNDRVSISFTKPLLIEATSWSEEAEGCDNERPSKRRGDSPSLTFARMSDDESPRAGKLRRKLLTDYDCGTEGDSCSEGPISIVHNCSQEYDSSLISIDHKYIGQLEILQRLQRILDNIQNTSQMDVSSCESCNTFKAIITTIQEQLKEVCGALSADPVLKPETVIASSQTDSFSEELDMLKQKMSANEARHSEEKLLLIHKSEELEKSLEMMRDEYEKTEEYYTKKLAKEREHYNEDIRISDERLMELTTKITEYEQQFTSKLPTIDEKCSLENQYLNLEEEFEIYKVKKQEELSGVQDELKELQDKIKSLELKQLTSGCETLPLSTASSPIEYLWSQGTIRAPFSKTEADKKMCVRDYQNPAFVQSSQSSVRCASDSEKDKLAMNPIQRPGLNQRSSSVGTLRDENQDAERPPNMISCSDLEGQLRRQPAITSLSTSRCSTNSLEQRCRQLQAALRHHQMLLETVQQNAMSENSQLRNRVSAAEASVAHLQQRLSAADLLVRDLYIENCHLAHAHPHSAHKRTHRLL